jgi:hypothetical protein
MLLSIVVTGMFAASVAADTIAITDVSVLPMDAERVLTHQTLLIAGDRIVAMGDARQVRLPRGARVIDGRGKFVLPGLADMHVHLSTPREFPLFVGSGVLTVRDLNGDPEKLQWRNDIASGRRFGPRLFVSGPMIAGPGIPWQNKVVPTTPAAAESVVVAQQRAGYDQIKIYDGLPADVFAAAMSASKRIGMRSSGHIPQAVGFDGVLASGMNGLEHLDKTIAATMGHDFDTLRIPSIADRIKQSGAYVTPTLESMAQIALVSSGRFDSLINRPEAQHAPAELREFWNSVTVRLKGNRTPDAAYPYGRYTDIQLRLAAALAARGVPMLSGTDLPNVVLVPGVSLHRELEMMRVAGLTRYQVLESSTSAPARFFGQSGDWGTVAVGRRANLLLVDENPLVDLATLRAPFGVVLAGIYYDAVSLARMRDGATPDTRP